MSTDVKILLSALAAEVVPRSSATSVISTLKADSTQGVDLQGIARAFHKPQLMRQIRTANRQSSGTAASIEINGASVSVDSEYIGRTQILYKSPLPGELQARLAVESAIDRFLEYLLKKYQIVVLNESDRHVQVFIPAKNKLDFTDLWDEFLQIVLFSSYGIAKYQIPGLLQTFVAMLNSVKLANRGFAPQDFPIISKDQVQILVAWYYAVIQQVGKRQTFRQEQIEKLGSKLQEDLSDKERKAISKDLENKQDKQIEESEKYRAFRAFLDKQVIAHKSLNDIRVQLKDESLDRRKRKTLERQEFKTSSSIYLEREPLENLLRCLEDSNGDPFEFIKLDTRRNPARFKNVTPLVKYFTDYATEQINSTTGANFTKCFSEIYRLLSLEKFAPLPSPLLTATPLTQYARGAGDSGGEFCYSCGIELSQKNKEWQIARFIFERPSQRLQSSSSESRPKVCLSCFALAFASPLKVTDESIILRLSPVDGSESSFKLKDYIRMLTNKSLNMHSGKYVMLSSDYVGKGDKKKYASEKLGQVQYALAKVASIFPQEVLADFKFCLVLQGSEIELPSRHLLFIKGLMKSYGQFIVQTKKITKSGKESKEQEINMSLGDAIRYIQQDLPYLADYSLVKIASISNRLELEQTRSIYWEEMKKLMDSNSAQSKRAKLYQDVAALTGLTYAFVSALESRAKKSEEQKKDEKYTAREVGKIIEKSDDATAFCYYATLGDTTKERVDAKLYHNPSNDFIYSQTLSLLENLEIPGRNNKDDKGSAYIQLYADDVSKAYTYFASQEEYKQEKGWRDLTYNLKLSLYTRFPELVRKLKSTKD